MARRPSPPQPPADFSDLAWEDYGGSASTTSLRHWTSFTMGAVRRRKVLTGSIFVSGLALTVAVYAFTTPKYEVETKILAQRQLALPSAVRSSGTGDSPTRTAEELILRRESLLDLVKRADLMGLPANATSTGPSPLAAALFKLGLGPDPATLDPVTAMVNRLDKAIQVTATEETVKISVRWPDPVQAYQIVEGSLQNFLEARQTQEITAIDEAIAVLQSRLAGLRNQLDREETRRDDSRREEPLLLDPGSAPRSASAIPPSAEVVRIKSLLDAKERAIRDMEDFRQRRLLELQAQLSEKRNVYAEAHPVVIGLRKEVEAFSLESPQIAALQDQARQLRAEYAALLAADGGHSRSSPRALPPRSLRDGRGNGTTQDDRVKDVRAQYLNMLERVSAFQLELDAARAAFKYRYKVIWPAELPRSPVSPNPWKVLPVGLLASILLALVAALVPDLWSRRIFETWQVERDLGLEVLSDLRANERKGFG